MNFEKCAFSSHGYNPIVGNEVARMTRVTKDDTATEQLEKAASHSLDLSS